MYLRSYRSKTAARQSKPGSKRWVMRFFLIFSQRIAKFKYVALTDHTYIKLAILVPKKGACVKDSAVCGY